MNNKSKSLLIASIIAVVGFSGCSVKKVSMRALVPAEVPVLTAKRNVAVSKFADDKVHLSSKIEAELAKVTLDKKNFFTVTNRSQLYKVLKEQKFQSSDLSDPTSASKIGKLIGAQAIIGGSVMSSHEDGSYVEQRERCTHTDKKGRCVRTKTYNVTCPTSSATVSASINVIDVETAQTIHAQTITKEYSADGCKISALWGVGRRDGKIKSGSQALVFLADNVAKSFAIKLSPRYVSYRVELMEDVDSVELTDKQEKVFENALKYLENGRMEKSEKLFDKLYGEVGEKAFEVAYDLGLVKQSLGKYEEAQTLYKSADGNTPEPNKLLDKAILDIEDSIKKQKEAESQLGQK